MESPVRNKKGGRLLELIDVIVHHSNTLGVFKCCNLIGKNLSM